MNINELLNQNELHMAQVLDKTTNHSSSERHVISDIMGTALNRALGKKIQQITEKLDEIEDGEERKTE